VFFGRACEWIDEVRGGDQPFFAYITPNAPHSPLISPGKRYDDLYAGKSINGVPLKESDVAYYAMISNIDENVGRLLGGLAERGLERKTLVIFMCDNGGTHTHLFNAGFRGRKVTPYYGGTHSPALWRWPGTLPAGVDCDAMTAHYDVFPTLAALAGEKLNDKEVAQVEGRSLLPLLKEVETAWPERTFVTHVGRWPRGEAAANKYVNCAVRKGQYQLVNNRELYDLQLDPGQQQNVAAKHPEVAAQLRKAFDAWWAEAAPLMCNEEVPLAAANPYRVLYERQLAESGADEVTIDANGWYAPIAPSP
jgi:arylsulfatase